MVERELINLVGGFKNISGPEDYECWKEMLLHEESLFISTNHFLL